MMILQMFLTGYAESIGRNIQLLPIHIDKKLDYLMRRDKK